MASAQRQLPTADSTERREDVYATLLLNDSYLPGALVLAHSLRDAGTSKKLAVLVTMDSLSTESITELKKLYDYILPVERIVNQTPANLHLMNRLDLGATFTKVTLWRQEQFRRIVYIDADVVALRAPDELFDLPYSFSAAPDIGWPDLFNSGVMVLSPNMGDYYALIAMAQRGISFDGADQGLLNTHFKNSYHRLPFTYNVTPSGHYQYVPAFRHFQSSINMVHFIGADKPWTQGRDAHKGGGPYDELVGRWWAVYDRHYRLSSAAQGTYIVPGFAQKYVKGEYTPNTPSYSSYEGFYTPEPEHSNPAIVIDAPSSEWEYLYPEKPEPQPDRQPDRQPDHQPDSQPDSQPYPQSESHQDPSPVHSDSQTQSDGAHAEHNQHKEDHVEHHEHKEQHVEYYEHKEEHLVQVENKSPQPVQVHYTPWDASRAPPPVDSKPEASNFPDMIYTMSTNPEPFKAPEKYPDPPKDMYYEVPKTPSFQKPAPIFPWEKSASKPSRVFAEDTIEETRRISISSQDSNKSLLEKTPVIEPIVNHSDPWQSYTRSNAWDDIPQIENYIGHLQRNRKGSLQILQGGYGSGTANESVASPGATRRPSMKLTDFPTELERPSLPVTPAPIRRPTFWGGERDEDGELPAAEGVPEQADWDPTAQLEMLAQQQAQVLSLKLGKTETTRDIPSRPLPYGSEGVISPTYVPQTANTSSSPPASFNGNSITTSKAPSASLSHDHISEDETPAASSFRNNISQTQYVADEMIGTDEIPIEEPSYRGHGTVWDRDEDVRGLEETPLGASEEELDVLMN